MIVILQLVLHRVNVQRIDTARVNPLHVAVLAQLQAERSSGSFGPMNLEWPQISAAPLSQNV